MLTGLHKFNDSPDPLELAPDLSQCWRLFMRPVTRQCLDRGKGSPVYNEAPDLAKMSERIAPDILADVCDPLGVCISPDGTKIVYMSRPLLNRKSENIESALWMAEVGKQYSARQITSDDVNNNSPKFSPDGKFISFLSDRSKPGKASILYLLPLDGGEALPLISIENEMGVGGYQWRPDGGAIAFTSADEKSEERKQKDKDKDDAKVYDEDIDHAKLRVVDVKTKEVRTLESTEANVNVSQIVWNKQGTKIAYTTTKSPDLHDWQTNHRFHAVDVEEDSSQFLCEYPSYVSGVVWHEEDLLWVGGYVPDSRTSAQCVYSLSIKDPSQGFQRIAHGETDCVSSIIHKNDNVFVQVQQGLTDIVEFLDGTEIFREKVMIFGWDVHFQSSQTILAIAQGRIGKPVEVFSVANGTKTQLSQHGKHIAEKELGRAHLLEYTHEDGTPIDGLYAIPATLESAFQERKPQPTVLVVRGGPYARVTDSFEAVWNYTTFFMSLGYLVLSPNYRGGSSHGHDYANAVRQDASQSYQDVIWLVKKGIEDGYIDPDRVALTGWSQGGFMAYLSVTRDSTFHFCAAVAGAGVTDWTTMPLTTDTPAFETEISGPAAWAMEDLTDLTSRKCSPIYHMHDIKTPLLIVHGQKDERTPVEQAIGFYRGMKARGQEVKLVTYPREGHCWPVPWEKKHYVHMMETIEKFLDKHMKVARD